jgi:surface antigen/peptidoglycan hydrolase CwlO-like protein
MMRGIVKKISLLLTVVFVAGFAVQTNAANLDDLYQQKDQLSEELEKAESSSKTKQKEIQSLSQQISSLEGDIKATESKIAQTTDQISVTQTEISSLDEQVKQKTAELNGLKKKINSSLVEIYRFSSRSSWELILSSGNLGESSNQVKYVEAIQIQVKSMYNKLLDIKEDLDREKSEQEAKKEELDNLKQRQEEYKKGSEYQVSQKDKLKNMTEQQKQEYDALAVKLQGEIANISSEIYSERLRQSGGGGWQLGGGGSGYPFGCGSIDPWKFYACQCTSYAAWYWNAVLGKPWTNKRPGSGSAYNWPALAQDQGYSVSGTPRAGAIISWGTGLYPGDQWGHVAIVESVNSDGTINISEYNYIYREGFSRRNNVDPASEGVSYSFIY